LSDFSDFSEKYKRSESHVAHVKPMANRECCKIDAIVTIDAKGQVVLPKDLRERAQLNPNDKIAIIGVERGNKVCCLVMMKAEALGTTVKNMLGPIFEEALK
jgi:antitoxin PrlF